MALSIATTRFGSNLTNYDGTGTNASCGVAVSVNTTAIIVVVVIYDASATDGIISDMTIGHTAPGFKTMTKVDEYYDATCGGHVSIWYLNAVWGGSYGMSLDPTLGGTVTDWWSAAMVIEGDQIAVDAIATEATGNGSATITWSTVETDTIAVSCALSDQQVATNITANDTTFDELSSAGAEDLGSDSAMAAYAVRTSSGSQTIDWSDSDNDEDWVAIGVSFKVNTSPTSSKPAFLVGAVGEVYKIDVEENNLTDFTGTSGGVSVNSTTPLVGSYDVQVDISAGDTADDYGYKTNSAGLTAVSLRFYYNADSVNGLTTDGESLRMIQGRTSGTPASFLYFGLSNTGGTLQYYYVLTDDNSSDSEPTRITALSGDVVVELHLVSETYDGANDGYAEWWINGTKQSNNTSWSQNYNVIRGLNQIDYGNNARSSASVNGTLYMDDIILRDDGAYIGFDPTDTSDNQIAYLEGQSLASQSDNQIAYTRGSLDATPDTQSAYMHGAVATTSTKSCFTMGMEAGFSLYFRDDFETNDFSAWTSTTGAQLTTSTQSAMSGTYGMQTEIDDGDPLYAYLNTNDNISEVIIEFLFDPNDVSEHDFGWNFLVWGNMPSYTGLGNKKVIELEFTDSTTGPPQLRYVVFDDDDGDGWYSNYHTINQGPNKIRLHWTGVSDWAIYLDDTLAQSSTISHGKRRLEEFRFGLTSGGSNQGTMYFDQFWMFVKYADSDNQPAYLRGAVTTSDNQIAFLAGSLDDSDTQLAYLAGSLDDLDNQIAYTAGGIETSDNQIAYLHGSLDDSDTQIAWLAGGIETSDNQIAYLEGDAILVSDSKYAYTAGQDTASDNQIAFLAGGIQDSDSTLAFLAGGLNVLSTKWGYAVGQDTDLDSIPAYLIGSQDDSDTKTAYLAGWDTAQSNQIAFLAGQSSSQSNQIAFLVGQDTALASIWGYTAGLDTASDNLLAFLAGSLDDTDSTYAYTSGQDIAIASIEAFTGGGLAASDNQPAYIYGSGEVLYPDGDISQSGSWKREDESSSNLYTSIDEQPGHNDADYVYHSAVAGTEYFEVALSNPVGSLPGTGEVRIYWRGKRMQGAGSATMRVQLRENTTIIAQSDEVFTDENVTYFYTLSQGEKDSITDWNNLRLRFIVQGVA